eukprot:TRINITY_DN2956_c0_g1_i1.p1 TRINITY_DN2956_c0_g1~~TRINITY_DN2956_c0_g1_i1.p1  ORF type:complete len:131 (-),score=6.04 TRINITY_DN2956_c0_g1_i1:13-405(-)
MYPSFLHPIEILPPFVIHSLSDGLHILTVLVVLLSIQEPKRDFVLLGVGHNFHQGFKLFNVKFTSSLIQINLSLFADKIGESAPNSTNASHGIHNLLVTIDIRVHHTKNLCEIFWLNQTHLPIFSAQILD